MRLTLANISDNYRKLWGHGPSFSVGLRAVLASMSDGDSITCRQPGLKDRIPSNQAENLPIGVGRVNLGCGSTPTPGWLNFDNSVTVRCASFRQILGLLHVMGLVSDKELQYASVLRQHGIVWANASRRIPLPDRSVEVVYSSHMLEHLDPKQELPGFLAEVRRILVPQGILRIGVPDLLWRARRYLEETHDADAFVSSLSMVEETPRSKLAQIRRLAVGFRGHRWMYDADSLTRLLQRAGFCSVQHMPPGETTIPDSGYLNLREREEGSVYVEARNE
jgi:predicted SAM-dependent methyltransferase